MSWFQFDIGRLANHYAFWVSNTPLRKPVQNVGKLCILRNFGAIRPIPRNLQQISWLAVSRKSPAGQNIDKNLFIFIKNVVAVAAYSRLASRSQAKFHTKKLSPLVRPCAGAPHPPIVHFDFRLASERTWVLSLTEPVAFPGVFEDEDRRVIDCQKTRQLVPGCVFLVK